MFVGIGELDPTTQQALTARADRRRGEENYLHQVEQRSAETMRVGTRMLLDAIPAAVAETPIVDKVDAQRKPSRFYLAGLLHVIGTQAQTGLGDLDTHRVTLATHVDAAGYTYESVSVAMQGVYTGAEVRLPGQEIDPQAVNPDGITEARFFVQAHRSNAHRDYDLVEATGSWVGTHDMPDTYQGRDNYVEPQRVGSMAQQMLVAMTDPGLNPQFQSHEFLVGVSPELAEQACDVERPLSEIQFELILPTWAKARVGSEV